VERPFADKWGMCWNANFNELEESSNLGLTCNLLGKARSSNSN
jgi:hypothetical protein